MKGKKVEFYFVLYLAAIVTLFAVSHERDRSEEDVVNLASEIIQQGEGSLVSLKFLNNFSYNVKLDTHLINYPVEIKGKVKNPHLKILTWKKLPATKINFTDKFITKTNDSMALYLNWKPTISDTGNYQIIFEAHVIPTLSKTVEGILHNYSSKKKNRILEVLISRLKDVVITDTMNFTVSSSTITDLTSIMTGTMINQDLKLVGKPEVTTLRIPGRSWQNIFTVTGGVDASNQLDLQLSNAEDVITDRTPTGFVIKGSSNLNIETKEIKVTAIDNSNRKDEFSFSVRFVTPQPKPFEKKVFIGETYTFDGRLIGVDESIVLEYFVNGTFRERFVNEFNFTPSQDDKEIIIRRSIDGNDIGIDTKVLVAPLPPPEITDPVSQGDGSYSVITKCFGKNNDTELRFRSGGNYCNISTDGMPFISADGSKNRKWKIILKPSIAVTEFEIIVYTKDSRGKSSDNSNPIRIKITQK